MSDPLERVLRLVADGRLTADEAGPILDALSVREHGRASEAGAGSEPRAGGVGGGVAEAAATDRAGAPRFARIMVMEGGRRVVDLRVPASLGRFALGKVPGLSTDQVNELQQAISIGQTGPLLEVEDPDGDGVRIILE